MLRHILTGSKYLRKNNGNNVYRISGGICRRCEISACFSPCDSNSLRSEQVRSFSGQLLPPKNSKEKIKLKPTTSTTSILPSLDNSSSSRMHKNDKDILPTGKKNKTKRGRRRGTTSSRPHIRQSDKKRASRIREKPRERTRHRHTISDIIRGLGTVGNILQHWFRTNHGKTFTKKSIKFNSVQLGRFSMWKATFECPVTGEIFDCGTLSCLPPKNNYMTINGQTVYVRKIAAKQAAYARAIDCLRYRQNKSHADRRMCVEMPYVLSGSESETKIDAVAGSVTVENNVPDSDDDEDSSAEESDEADFDGFFSDDEDDDEEYTIQYLPGSSAVNNNQPSATVSDPLARVIEGATTLQNQAASTSSVMTVCPEQELQQVVENARGWIKQEQYHKSEKAGSAHRVMLHGTDFSRTLELGNSVLQGLAKAHRRVQFEAKPRGVENVANSILRYLWSTRAATPTADTYVAYLACLEGSEPVVIANRAKTILKDMKVGTPVDNTGDKVHPKPTIGVVNAVIQLCAQVGGETGRKLLDDILGDILDDIPKPNRETALSLLSCMSYPPSVDREVGGFDPIFAQECIEKLKKMMPINLDTTDIYNAALRWSGGLASIISRPYTMSLLQWDSYEEIFRYGFQPFNEESACVQDAYRMHAWLEEMAAKENAVTAPNIETYEAVIQAYVRTGTLKGLEQAETILDSLMNNSMLRHMLRMQTFHPVVAAWAYSGHKQARQKVNKWIDRLEALGEDSEHSLQVDCRVGEASLLASATRLVNSLEEEENELSYSRMEDLIDIAHGCSIRLNESADKKSHALLDVKMFVLVLNAWGKLGLALLKAGKSEEANLSLGKMIETVDGFETLVLSLHKRKSSCPDFISMQLKHLVGNTHKVYSAFFTLVRAAQNVPLSSDSAWLLEKHVGIMERGVRRMEELDTIHDSTKNADELLYGDMFSYIGSSSLPRGCSETRVEFLIQILKSLNDDFAENLSAHRRGDLIRLCFLTADLLSIQRHESSLTSTYKDLVGTICRMSSSSEDQEALLGRLLHQIVFARETQSFCLVDYDTIVKEIQKYSSGTAARLTAESPSSRSRYRHLKVRRSARSSSIPTCRSRSHCRSQSPRKSHRNIMRN